MACTTVENLFIEHAALVRNDVVKSIQDSDFYIKNMPKEPWLDGQGYQYSYPIYERSMVTKAVTDSDFFQDFATLDDTPNGNNNFPDDAACNVTGHNIESFGITIRQVSLKKAAVNSPDICLDTLRFQWQVMDQIKNITRVLAENTKWVWSNTYQDEYSNAAANKVTAKMSGTTISDTFDATDVPTSVLTFGILEEVHQELGFLGGGVNPTARVDGTTPVYTAVGSLYTFNDLKKKSDNTRNDFRYMTAGGGSDQGALVRDLGLGGIYQGFTFATVQFPPRWDDGGATYIRRYPYSSASATRGKKWEVTSEYKNAAFEDTAIWHSDVLKVLIPRPGGSMGGMSYQQQYSWAGEFVWRNIPDRDCNIDGNIGFFRALFAYGIKLERPDLGFIIRHLRCDRDQDTTDCTGT